jgi:hypothetical protein
MPIQRELRGANRTIAALLAGVWLASGAAGVAIGIVQHRLAPLIVGVLAIGYGVLWSRAVRRGRMLAFPSLRGRRR